MARIPVLDGPTVRQQGLPKVDVGGPDTRGTHGEAIREGMANLSHGAEGFAEAQRREKSSMDDARIMDAYAKVSNWQNERIYHPEKGAFAVKGEKAIGISDSVIQDFDKVLKDIDGTLDDAQRARFQQIAQRERESTYRELTRHEGREAETFRDQAAHAAIDASVSKATNAYDSPEVLSAQQQMGEGAIVLRGQQLGMSGQAVQEEVSKYRTRLHLSVLDRMTDAGRGDLAAAYLQKYGPEIDGDARGKSNIDKVVGALNVKGRADLEALRIEGAAGAEEYDAQTKQALQISDPSLRDAVVERLEQRRLAKDGARKTAEEQRLGRVYQQISGSGGYLDKNSKDFQQLSDAGKARALEKAREDRDYFRRLREKKQPETEAQRDSYIDLRSDMFRYPQKYRAMTVDQLRAEWGHKLTPDQFSEAGLEFARLRKTEADAEVVGGQEYRNRVEEQIKASPQLANDARLANKYRFFLAEQRRQFRDREKRDPSYEDVIEMEAKAHNEVTVKGRLWNSTKPAYQVGPSETTVEKSGMKLEIGEGTEVKKAPKIDRAKQLRAEGKTNAEIAKTLSAEGY